MTSNDTTFIYKGVPKDVSTRDPKDIIHSGNTGAPFLSDVTDLEQRVQDVRMNISKELDKWAKVKAEARQNNDDNAFDRATNELDGLYDVLSRLREVAS
jgi:hypothetical protein